MSVKWGYNSKADYLSFIININDDDYNKKDYIGLIFDRNQNDMIDLGMIDKPYGLWADGMTAPSALMENGGLAFAEMPPEPGGLKSTFDPEKGYTFEIPFIRCISPQMPDSILLRIIYGDRNVPAGKKIRVIQTDDIRLNF